MNKEELLKEISKTEEHLASMKKMLKDSEYERWRPKLGETYYYTTSTNGIPTADWNDYDVDNSRYDIGNCFETEQEAKAELEKILVRRMLEDIARRLNKGKKPDWIKCYQKKYYLGYDQVNSKITLECRTTTVAQGTVYCLDETFRSVAIQEIGAERLKKYLRGE